MYMGIELDPPHDEVLHVRVIKINRFIYMYSLLHKYRVVN